MATAFQSNAFQTAPLAFQITVGGNVRTVDGVGIGWQGGPVPHKEIIAILEARKAAQEARERAEREKKAKWKKELEEAARLTDEVLDSQAADRQAEVDRLAKTLEAAATAKKNDEIMRQAHAAIAFANELLARADDEEVMIALLS